jgi:hypothetical protein
VRRALVLLLGLSACGDDGKQGGSPLDGERPAPVPQESRTPIAHDPRIGDFTTWEIRVAGTEAVTTVTWRVRAVESTRANFSIESKTVEPDGRVLAQTASEESRDFVRIGPGRGGPTIGYPTKDFVIAGRTIRAKNVNDVWTSDEVPLGGIVQATSAGGVEQTLVDWGRGPAAGG